MWGGQKIQANLCEGRRGGWFVDVGRLKGARSPELLGPSGGFCRAVSRARPLQWPPMAANWPEVWWTRPSRTSSCAS